MKDFVTFEIAKNLKEKGFKEPCFGWYYPNEICGYDYKTLIIHNRSACIFDKYEDLLILHNDDKHIDSPTISQVVSWLLDKKKIFLTVDIEPMGFFYIVNYDMIINDNGKYEFESHTSNGTYTSPEEAYECGIEYILNNLI